MLQLFVRRFSLSLPRQSKAEWKRRKDRKLVDWRRVRVWGGAGGDGCVSFRRSPKVRLGAADGGNGGHGGAVVFTASLSVKSLAAVRTHYHAGKGGRGQGALKTGKRGSNVVVKVPLGTVVKDTVTGAVLDDLMKAGDSCTVVHGGEGGLGNAMFATAEHRRPLEFTVGGEGEEKSVEVEMKTIADVGMVGFPNAGKSTLLRAISQATPEVAAYPFTTLNPHIGMVGGDKFQVAVADIPGLIPGAHDNKGLGLSFLRHIERCKTLLYVLDASSTQPDMCEQLQTLQTELKCYNPSLTKNASLVVANKMDVATHTEEGITQLQHFTSLPIIPISGLCCWNIQPLLEVLFKIYKDITLATSTLCVYKCFY